MLALMDEYDFLYLSLIRDVYFQGKVLGRKYQLLRISYSVFMYGLVVSGASFCHCVCFLFRQIIFQLKSYTQIFLGKVVEMKNKKKWMWVLLVCAISCNGQKISYKSPKGYDLSKPDKFNMPEILHEISGITFNRGISDTIYAEQDEEGKLFHFKLGDKKKVVSKFGKPGDYEDVTICNGFVIMLRSDGVLFSFPLTEANNEKAKNVQEWKNLFAPDGELQKGILFY